MLADLNWFAVVLAAAAALAVGAVWYLPPVLGTAWASRIKTYAGLTDADIAPDPMRHLSLWLVGTLVNAVVVAILFREMGVGSVGRGLLVGAGLWLGLGATFSSWPAIFARQPWSVWLINNGAFLGMQLAIAATVVAIG